MVDSFPRITDIPPFPPTSSPATLPSESAPSTVVVEATDIHLYRGRTTLVGPLNWTVRQGEQWIIFGPNGAGKSSLLQILGGEMFPSRGTLSVLGERFGKTNIAELRCRIGVSSNALAQGMPAGETVFDVVRSAGYGTLGRWRETFEGVDDDRACTLLEDFSVIHLKDRRFGSLSEGERKRVLIARALMADPELLLLDEPSSGLDLGGREDLMALLEQLAEDPHSPCMLMVTHHVEEIPRGFTHGLILKNGEAVHQGTLSEVISSSVMSEAFAQPIEVESSEGRFFAHRDYTGGRHQG